MSSDITHSQATSFTSREIIGLYTIWYPRRFHHEMQKPDGFPYDYFGRRFKGSFHAAIMYDSMKLSFITVCSKQKVIRSKIDVQCYINQSYGFNFDLMKKGERQNEYNNEEATGLSGYVLFGE